MSVSWKDFAKAFRDRRFILPLREFTYQVQYVTNLPRPDQIQKAGNLIVEQVLAAVRGQEGCELNALRVVPGASAESESAASPRDREPSFFNVLYENPVFHFSIQLGPTTFQITKQRSSLEELILTAPLLERTCAGLFGGDAATSLADALGIRDRIHRVHVEFELALAVGGHIAEPARQATNVEVLSKLVKTSFPGNVASPEREAPIAALGPEGLLRGDATVHFKKTLGDRVRSLYISFEGPYNVTQRDIDLRFGYICGAGAASALQEADLSDWATPLVDYYRDMVLNRFMPDLFYDIEVHSRL